jgi:hypothetical protein
MQTPGFGAALCGAGALALALIMSTVTVGAGQTPVAAPATPPTTLFETSTQCMACHNGLVTATGEDVSFGTAWRASMMAHAARDPYWHAGVRREVIDHPAAQAAIENECSRCHMPMAHVVSQVTGRQQSVFANVAVPGAPAPDPLATDGVSCALCHQTTAEGLGMKSSFGGGFAVDTVTPRESRLMYGPFEVTPGRTELMRSATGFKPATSTHIQQSEMCATCHTLYTHALDKSGQPLGEFPEQMPYQEWLHSEFRTSQSCQACHMPPVDHPTPISSVVGDWRDGVSRHDFRGANFLMIGLLNRFRADLGVVARSAELDSAALRSRSFLQSSTAQIEIATLRRNGDELEAEIVVRNLAGHKLPTAYPSRRVSLHVTVRDRSGALVFSSGGIDAAGRIAGNDNDADPLAFEPHYREIRSADEVQIYETIMGTPAGAVTTGLLSAVSYLKDNRLLPRGFDKPTAPPDVAVAGAARDDPDFVGGEDRVRYLVKVAGAAAPFTVDAELSYQSIAYRWAENLRAYEAPEPQRFVRYYESVAPGSSQVLARTTRTIGSAGATAGQ